MSKASQIYEALHTDSMEGRDLEASLLSRAARKLTRCAQTWEDEPQSRQYREKLDEALLFNQKLWTLLQVELSDPGHALPETLRVNLLRLSHYVDQAIFRLYSGGKLSDLRSLARINEELAMGLIDGTRTAASAAEVESLTELSSLCG